MWAHQGQGQAGAQPGVLKGADGRVEEVGGGTGGGAGVGEQQQLQGGSPKGLDQDSVMQARLGSAGSACAGGDGAESGGGAWGVLSGLHGPVGQQLRPEWEGPAGVDLSAAHTQPSAVLLARQQCGW